MCKERCRPGVDLPRNRLFEQHQHTKYCEAGFHLDSRNTGWSHCNRCIYTQNPDQILLHSQASSLLLNRHIRLQYREDHHCHSLPRSCPKVHFQAKTHRVASYVLQQISLCFRQEEYHQMLSRRHLHVPPRFLEDVQCQ